MQQPSERKEDDRPWMSDYVKIRGWRIEALQINFCGDQKGEEIEETTNWNWMKNYLEIVAVDRWRLENEDRPTWIQLLVNCNQVNEFHERRRPTSPTLLMIERLLINFTITFVYIYTHIRILLSTSVFWWEWEWRI